MNTEVLICCNSQRSGMMGWLLYSWTRKCVTTLDDQCHYHAKWAINRITNKKRAWSYWGVTGGQRRPWKWVEGRVMGSSAERIYQDNFSTMNMLSWQQLSLSSLPTYFTLFWSLTPPGTWDDITSIMDKVTHYWPLTVNILNMAAASKQNTPAISHTIPPPPWLQDTTVFPILITRPPAPPPEDDQPIISIHLYITTSVSQYTILLTLIHLSVNVALYQHIILNIPVHEYISISTYQYTDILTYPLQPHWSLLPPHPSMSQSLPTSSATRKK